VTASKSSVPAILPSSEENSTPANTVRALASSNADVAPKDWPSRPGVFPDLLTPTEAAQYLRLDELGSHTPETAIRTLNYWRDRKQLLATKYARHVWYRRSELDRFLAVKTES
jgi:hypothetical protein